MKLDKLGVNGKLLAIFTTATLAFGAGATLLDSQLDYIFDGKDVLCEEKNDKYVITLSNGDVFEVTEEELQEKFDNNELKFGLNTYEFAEGETCALNVSEDVDFKTSFIIGSFLVMFASGKKIFSDCLTEPYEKKFSKNKRRYS